MSTVTIIVLTVVITATVCSEKVRFVLSSPFWLIKAIFSDRDGPAIGAGLIVLLFTKVMPFFLIAGVFFGAVYGFVYLTMKIFFSG